MYKLANAFVHADWTASNATMGGLRPERTDGAAEGVGEILYLVMETAAATVMLSASDEMKERLNDDLWELRLMIRGTPERLRGQFIRLPLTEPMGILPDGRILVSAVKRREEWPEEEEKRSMDEMQELVSRITVTQMDMYKLANAFVHADWTASNATMGGLRPERTGVEWLAVGPGRD